MVRKETQLGFHEQFGQAKALPGGSDRSFCIVFFLLFAALAGYFWQTGIFPLLLPVAAVFLLLALFKPSLAAPLNRKWMQLGGLLARVMNPLFLGILYYGAVAPMGIIMRLIGYDPLRRKFDPAASSYWIKREPPGPPPPTMKQQF